MDYIYDSPYADVFLCNGGLHWHDFYYISPDPAKENLPYYQINRTGIEQKMPSLFSVSRTDKTPYCEIFCITSGSGHLTYRGNTYKLKKNQLILMNSHEPHSYSSNANDPLGNIWIEFCGSDSIRLMNLLIQKYSPVYEGPAFLLASQEISLLQQHLSTTPSYNCSCNLYNLLFRLLFLSERDLLTGDATSSINWIHLESFITSHLNETISNECMAELCMVSLSHFINSFQRHYKMTPQRYIMKKKIHNARYMLTRSSLSISQISESLGFCNDSHFSRCFKKFESITPLQYRKRYR